VAKGTLSFRDAAEMLPVSTTASKTDIASKRSIVGFPNNGRGPLSLPSYGLVWNALEIATRKRETRSAMLARLLVIANVRRKSMKSNSKLAIATLTGAVLGAAAVQGLHAQAKPPAYVISEIDVTNKEAYAKEYVPLAVAALRDSGQKQLAAGGQTAAISGEPPKSRVVLSVFENIDRAKAAYTSPAYLEARKIGDKYARLRIFAVEGVPSK
jgi:uncharacterized protein (DUF1330 family)